MKDCLIGTAGVVLTQMATPAETVNLIVGIICSAAIALTTCAVQIYRLWRDRNSDKKKSIQMENKKEDE